MSKPIMTIIGFGPMGKKLTALFSKAFEVRVSSSGNVKDNVDALGATTVNDLEQCLLESNYIFLAIPIHALPGMIEQINKNARSDSIVIDCCSARLKAEKYLNSLKFQHYGLHELKTGELCVIGDIDDFMRSFFKSQNVRLTALSAEEHDRLNAIIGLGHFIGLSLDKYLTDDQKNILGGIGSGSLLIELMERLSSNTSTTWAETQIDNPFTEEIRRGFIKDLEEYNLSLSKGNYLF